VSVLVPVGDPGEAFGGEIQRAQPAADGL